MSRRHAAWPRKLVCRVTGVLGVLLRARRLGQIAAVKPAIDLLRSRAGFYVSSSLESKVLSAAGE